MSTDKAPEPHQWREALRVIASFVDDVEVTYLDRINKSREYDDVDGEDDSLECEWYDLWTSYNHAKKFMKDFTSLEVYVLQYEVETGGAFVWESTEYQAEDPQHAINQLLDAHREGDRVVCVHSVEIKKTF